MQFIYSCQNIPSLNLLVDRHPPLQKNDTLLRECRQEQGGLDGSTCNKSLRAPANIRKSNLAIISFSQYELCFVMAAQDPLVKNRI